MAADVLTSTEYMLHHLHHNASVPKQAIVDFSVFNYDTIFFSILILAPNASKPFI